MSDIQKYLALMADALHIGALGEEGCSDLAKALNGVPTEYHAAAFKAFLGGEDEAQDAPEDYAVVKTFDSSAFHVGDEIESNVTGDLMIVIKNSVDGMGDYVYCMFSDGSAGTRDKYHLRRTGRNFPAIAAILDKIRK